MTTSTAVSTDRIEREIFLKAPRTKVWRALSNAQEFGKWFGMALEGQSFEPGKTVLGTITEAGCGHKDLTLEMVIDKIEPEQLLSYRWHPYCVDPAVDYTKEPMTLVTFELSDADGGTLLKVVESGFDALPAERVAEAYRMNNAGWDGQLKNIEKYVTAA
jgi:uncharacterized protein YndB with AHSA1/START domain